MKVLLATDGSQHSIKAAAAVTRLLRLSGDSHVLVVHALPLVRFAGQDDVLMERAQRALDETAAALDLPAEQVTTRLELGEPGEALLRVAAAENVDVIVMGARGLSAGAALVLGSTSYKVLRSAPCPVLVTQ
ncbi:MAG TPA: universal stress protein [Sphingobacteriaceae bacterium]|nr:universal stress protein [Sphingobacteriaceae bacterium]